MRLRPRANLDVNRHFLCDTGRADYRWMNRGDRCEAPLAAEAGRLRAVFGSDAALLETGDCCTCIADAPHFFDNSESDVEALIYIVVERP